MYVFTEGPRFRKILEQRTSINSETGCWEYQGTNADGYGQVVIDHRFYYVHRLSAMIFLGYIPQNEPDIHALHKSECKSRACWNPDHIYLGTNDQNIQDMVRAGTGRNQNSDVTHCKHGHEFTEENTYWYQKPDGKMRRQCKECKAALDKESKWKVIGKEEVG